MILDIVVDVQKDFITGALANPQAQANVTCLAETVKAHARAGHWLFLTRPQSELLMPLPAGTLHVVTVREGS